MLSSLRILCVQWYDMSGCDMSDESVALPSFATNRVAQADNCYTINRALARLTRHRAHTSALVAALCVLTIACATTPKRATANLIVPGRCMKMTAESFTKPCAQRADGKLICDGVVVTATCVEVAKN